MKRILLYLIIYFAFFTENALASQAGENIWHLAAKIGTVVDQLSIDSATCCASTFTTIDSITHTLYSKIDSVNTDLQNCCNTIESTVESAQTQATLCCANIDGNLDTLDVTPIDIVTTGTMITTPGYYCLANDVTLTGTIIIASSDVVFDINKHTITGGNGLIVLGGNNRITIQNGAISSSSSIGISLNGTNDSITLKSLTISLCPTGIMCTNQTNLMLSHLALIDITAYGINATACSSTHIKDCAITGTGGSTSAGVSYTSSTGCVFFNNIKVDSFHGGFTLNDVTNLLAQNCVSCNNLGAPGFTISSSSSEHQNIILKKCTSINNASDGFNISGANDPENDSAYIFEECNAIGSKLSSSGDGFSINRPRGTFYKCNANQMNNGFNNFVSSSANCNFIGCVAENNSESGFLMNSSQNYFFMCTASNNSSTGFQFSSGANAADSCLSNYNGTSTNAGSGFTFSGQGLAANCTGNNNKTAGFMGNSSKANLCILFTQCVASGNLQNGYDLSNFVGTAATNTAITEKCYAGGNNTNGFNGNSTTNTAIFYLDTANNNGASQTVNNFSSIGSNSASNASITAGSRPYGINLHGN